MLFDLCRRKGLLICCFFVFACHCQAQISRDSDVAASEDSFRCSAMYQNLMDSLFPIYTAGIGPKLVVRYSALGEPEMQVSIHFAGKGRVETVVYESAKRGVLSQCESIVESAPKESFGVIEKRINVSKTRPNISSRHANEMRTGFFKALRRSLLVEESRVGKPLDFSIFDSPSFEIWYLGVNEFHVTANGGFIDQPASKNENPIVVWARSVLINVRKQR